MITWLEITVNSPKETVEAISNYMLELGSSGVVTDDTVANVNKDGFFNIKGYFPDNDRFSSIFSKISSYLESLKEIGFKTGADKIKIDKIIDDHFSENWKRHFKTIDIGKNLVISPPWENYEKKNNKINIEIDPARAFGTGGHPTTRLCLLLLEEICNREKIESMLDVGCGSGILAIAGKKMNIKKVVGLDNDPLAIEESIKNANKNSLKDDIYFYKGNLEDERNSYSLIVANIYSGLLCRMMGSFKKILESQGSLIVSGIMNDQEDIVVSFAQESNFTLIKRSREENWSAMVFKLGS